MSIQTMMLYGLIISNTLTQVNGNFQKFLENTREETVIVESYCDEQEKNMIALINKERASEGMPTLRGNAALDQMAEIRVQEIMALFSHDRPNDKTKAELIEEVGIQPLNYVAENIISGTVGSTAQSLMSTFMKSDCHRAWILSEEVNAVGVAIHRNEYNQIYAVQVFGWFPA